MRRNDALTDSEDDPDPTEAAEDAQTLAGGPPAEAAVVRSVVRAVDVLMALSAGPMRLGEVSPRVNLSKPTTHRILFSLKSVGMVTQDSLSGEYGLGPGCYRLMSAMANGGSGFSTSILEQLRDETGETITIHVRTGLTRLCIQELPSRQPLQYTAGLGATAGIYTGSAGKVLLAFMSDNDRDRILAEVRLAPVTAATITDMNTLVAELASVRHLGFAVSRGERAEGAMGTSAPILDPKDGSVLAALSILGPLDRMTLNLDRMIERVRETASQLSETVE